MFTEQEKYTLEREVLVSGLASNFLSVTHRNVKLGKCKGASMF